VVVGGDGASRADLDPGRARELDARTGAEPEHDDIGRDPARLGGHRGDEAVGAGLETLDAHAEPRVDPEGDQRVGDLLGHVGVEGGHGLRQLLDQGDVEPARQERLDHLQTDVATADHHRAAGVAIAQDRIDRDRVGDGVDPHDPGEIDPGERRA
jgi:hypothetical protein